MAANDVGAAAIRFASERWRPASASADAPETITRDRCGCEPRSGANAGRERRRDDQRAGAAVAQHVIVVGRRQQRVRRDRHDARLDRTQEDGGEIDRVEETDEHPLFRAQPKSGERVGAAVHPLGELAVRVRARIIDVGDLAGAPSGEIALDEVVRGVVVARNVDPGRARAMIGGARRHDGALLRSMFGRRNLDHGRRLVKHHRSYPKP